jgi:hypothetical protein
MTQRTLAAALFVASAVSVPPPTVSPADALAAFARFKALEGSWEGVSSKGWTERVTFQAIAGGSAVIETSFGAHPGETMVTAFVPDGDRLLLTHYCVARNQPRLVATEVDDDVKFVAFTFLDATNLPSRDQGHMDAATFRFVDDDHVTTRWTWYEDGKEIWMEEIRMSRSHAKAQAARDSAVFSPRRRGAPIGGAPPCSYQDTGGPNTRVHQHRIREFPGSKTP